MIDQFVKDNTILCAVLLAAALVIDITHTALRKGVGHAAVSFLAVFTSVCFLFAAAYGFIPPDFFGWTVTLCAAAYVINRLRPAHRV